MEKYAFRLHFHLPDDVRLQHDEKSIAMTLSHPEHNIILKALGKGVIKDTGNLALVGSGFSSEEEAYQCGTKLKQALLLISVKFKFGFDPGREITRFSETESEDKANEGWIDFVNDVHGLSTYPDKPSVRIASATWSVQLQTSTEIFFRELTSAYQNNSRLSDKQILALELYSLSHFESSLTARFVMLVTAVEALSYMKVRLKSWTVKLQS